MHFKRGKGIRTLIKIKDNIFRIVGFIILLVAPIMGRLRHPDEWPIWLVVIMCSISVIVIVFNIHSIIKSVVRNKRDSQSD